MDASNVLASLMAFAPLRDKGNAALAWGDTDLALACYGGALHGGDPSETHLVLSNRSLVYMKIGLPAVALQDAEACVRLRPDWGKGYLRLAAALLALGRPERAVQALQVGLEVLAVCAERAPSEPGAVEALTLQLAEAQAASAAAAARADHFNCFTCSVIVAGTNAFHCSKCLRAIYCGAPCQAAAWRTTHRGACKQLRALPERPRMPLQAWPPMPRAERSAESICQAILQLRSKHSVLPTPAGGAKEQSLRLLQAVRGGKPLLHIERLLAAYPTSATFVLDSSTSLATAVASERLDVVRLLLACGASVNTPATDFYSVAPAQPAPVDGTGTAIHNACMRSSPAILRALLESGGDPNARYEPLYLTRSQRQYSGDGKDAARLQCAELLLQAGADLEARDHQGCTSLRHLCELGDKALPLIRLLLRAGACPDATPHLPDIGPCIQACIATDAMHLGVLGALLEHGASVAVWPMHAGLDITGTGASTRYRLSPLTQLCAPRLNGGSGRAGLADRVKAFAMLLAAGMCASAVPLAGSSHSNLLSPLTLACTLGVPAEFVRLLLAHGAHPDAPAVRAEDSMCGSPLYRTLMLARGGAPGTVTALLAAGAARCRYLLNAAVTVCSAGVVGELLATGLVEHWQGGSTALPLCPLQCASVEALEARCSALFHKTPLQWAMGRGSTAILQLLLDAGAGSDAGLMLDEAGAPNMLHRLMRTGQLEAGAAALVLAHPGSSSAAQAQLASLSDCGQRRSLLHVAARKGHGAGVLELLAAGVSATAGDARGVLPLAELLGAGGKARNRAAPRREEYKKAVAALRVAASTAGGSTPLDPDSDGELRISG
jgi:ankyrin repeat protein